MRHHLDQYFKSAFTVDNVIFGFDEGDLKVLLIKRLEEPFAGHWALPGYFVRSDEDLDSAAQRVLTQLTGLTDVFLEQAASYGTIGRHPYGRVITVSYYSLVRTDRFAPRPDQDISEAAAWFPIKEIEPLAFDHDQILRDCLRKLRRDVRYRPIGFELLPPKFTLTELQHLYEAIWETELEKRNFRKKILSMNLLIDLDEMQEGVAHRPARLYRFDEQKYQKFLEEGFIFELKENKRKREG